MKHRYAINHSTTLQFANNAWQWINDETGSDTSDPISPADLIEGSFIFFEDEFDCFCRIDGAIDDLYDIREFVESASWDYCYDRDGFEIEIA